MILSQSAGRQRQPSITARSINASFTQKLWANPANGSVQRLCLLENLLPDGTDINVISRGLNKDFSRRNHVRLQEDGFSGSQVQTSSTGFIRPSGDIYHWGQQSKGPTGLMTWLKDGPVSPCSCETCSSSEQLIKRHMDASDSSACLQKQIFHPEPDV